MDGAPTSLTKERAPLSKMELVGLVASVMAMTALAIDMMLAALGDIGADFSLVNDNDRQLVIAVFMFASGAAQLFYGPLADRFGRRAVFMWSLIGFLAATLLCVVATAYSLFIAGRALQGVAAAAGRVVAIALVRDLFRGREMASIMSMAMTVSIVSPIIAPSLGQLILFVAPWRWVFIVLFGFAGLLLAWVFWRLPETLQPEDRRPLSFSAIGAMLSHYLSYRAGVGYTIGTTCVMASLMAYLTSSQQVYVDTYGLGAKFPLALGAVAISVGLAAIVNANLVRRFGMRRLSHSAIIAFAVINAANAVYLSMTGGGTVAGYMTFLIAAYFMMGLINANFSAIVMEPMGRMAGTASAVYGFITTTGSALLGGMAGRLYDGTAIPIVTSFAVFGLIGVIAVFIAEGGRLFTEPPAGPDD
ncbi:MAG: hypothetical protein CMI63_06485 [Parvularcula sp.]|nr:hypothetical protein [Parvularcula sp.]